METDRVRIHKKSIWTFILCQGSLCKTYKRMNGQIKFTLLWLV